MSLKSLLTETVTSFNQLEDQAHAALHEKLDSKMRKTLLEKRADLLIELPDRVRPLVAGLSRTAERTIMRPIEDFAGEAKRAKEEGVFALSVLLTSMGDKTDDPNWLQSFVKRIVAE